MKLGKQTEYITQYAPELLDEIPRSGKEFFGIDLWTAYEISWLNFKGKPEVAIGQFMIPCNTPFLIESKSLKLYLNSFNQTKFASREIVLQTIQRDLSDKTRGTVQVELFKPEDWGNLKWVQPKGVCIDGLDIEINAYDLGPKVTATGPIVTESIYSNLLKSNCLVTGQPDFATVFIEYTGPQMDHESLLRYIISFREHNEFHEQCVERIFTDLKPLCSFLSVYARYTRRGGLDINPFRTSNPGQSPFLDRLIRQ